uniref:MYND-type domain-containing protein n=1 Tax=Sphenodon punctatus TaxID=8508 RepID=A0A8D0L1J0_SPHPU
MGARRVELGFAEEACAWRLRSEQFPSKVGGRPAWLGESGLPAPAELRCGLCARPRALLLQLYALLPDRPEAFHRSLFVFACRGPACYRLSGPAPGSLSVFRNQLSRKNDTYSYDPPPEEPPPEGTPVSLQLKCGANLCRVCGCLGPKMCSKCHKASYCSRDHQIMDWKAGHKQSCAAAVIPDHKFLFPEYEIVIESEELESSDDNKVESDDNHTQVVAQEDEIHEEMESAHNPSKKKEGILHCFTK